MKYPKLIDGREKRFTELRVLAAEDPNSIMLILVRVL